MSDVIYCQVKLKKVTHLGELDEYCGCQPGKRRAAHGMTYFVINNAGQPEAYTLSFGTNRSDILQYFKDGRLYIIDTARATTLAVDIPM